MKISVSRSNYFFYLSFWMLVLSGVTFGQTFTGAGFSILDGVGENNNVGTCSTVNVSGITGSVLVSNVRLNNLSHSFIGDTAIAVFSPAGDGVALAVPPNGRECNYSGNYTFADFGTSSVDAATVGCSSGDIVPPGNYRTSNYGDGVNPGQVTSLPASYGTLSPAQANGNWLVCVYDYVSGGSGAVGGTSITLTAPTAATASISGRVTLPNDIGLTNAQVTLTDSLGGAQTVRTGKAGSFRFTDVRVGETYLLTVKSKRYTFQSQMITVNEDLTNVNFSPVE